MTYSKNLYQGKFVPKNPEKYIGNVKKIYLRSSYEIAFFTWCDNNPSVLKYSVEAVTIPYVSPKDKEVHRYFVDFIIQWKTKSGEVKTILVEIKPSVYTIAPIKRSKTTKKFLAEMIQWEINSAKWEAAREFCRKKGWEFLIITEYDLGLKTKSLPKLKNVRRRSRRTAAKPQDGTPKPSRKKKG